MSKKIKFSVIMPIYNVGHFLDESISSVINQTIDFERNIELILINDGSTDNSDEICKKYVSRYPNNVIYKKQKNSGVSKARNEGLKLATGEYINFFDADDIWNNDVFQKINHFFDTNKNIDLISCRQKYFEGKKSVHSLDYKYENGNKIININDCPNFIQLSVASVFIRTEVAKNYKFDEKLKYAEDAKYVTEIILKKEKYALMSDCIYNIRKRSDMTSATQNKKYKVEAYTDTVKYYYEYLVELSKNKYKSILPYIQYILINAIKYRVGEEIPENISPTIKKDYQNRIINIIKQIDDDVIINTNKVVLDTKLYLLKLKYDELPKDDLEFKDGFAYFKNKKIDKIINKNSFSITNMSLKKGKLWINGLIKMSSYFEFNHLYVDEVGKTYKINLLETDKNRKSFLNDDMNIIKSFSGFITLDRKKTRLMFYTKYNELDIIFKPNINIDKHNKMKKRCGILKNKIYSVKNNRTLLIEHFLLLRFVIKYLREVQMYFKKN